MPYTSLQLLLVGAAKNLVLHCWPCMHLRLLQLCLIFTRKFWWVLNTLSDLNFYHDIWIYYVSYSPRRWKKVLRWLVPWRIMWSHQELTWQWWPAVPLVMKRFKIQLFLALSPLQLWKLSLCHCSLLTAIASAQWKQSNVSSGERIEWPLISKHFTPLTSDIHIHSN